MNKSTAIAISGGIDSLISASILKQQNCNIFGIHFITGYENISYSKIASQMENIAKQLDIPITIIDCRKEFQLNVIDYFTMAYKKGITPNPCLVCNRYIKFGTVLQMAEKKGANFISTGHYARVEKDTNGTFHLFKGADHIKDQSYFLAFLNQKQLGKIRFPLGKITKADVKKLALLKGLEPVSSSESQDICFINNSRYNNFLMEQPGFTSSIGNILDISGNIIGKHNGLHLFTIGQRKGINCPGKEPYYVLKIDSCKNNIIVGYKKDLLADGCKVKEINWIGKRPVSPIKLSVKIRYRHTEVGATIYHKDDGSAVIMFATPQSAVTPGQAAVFYNNDELVGGGWIEGKNV